MVTIKINTDNSAFDGDVEAGIEVARILKRLANAFNDSSLSNGRGNIKDINGNNVGTVTVTGRSLRSRIRKGRF